MVWGAKSPPSWELGGLSTFLGDPVSPGRNNDFNMATGRICAINVSASRKVDFETVGNFGPAEKANAIGMAISQLRDLLIYGSDVL